MDARRIGNGELLVVIRFVAPIRLGIIVAVRVKEVRV